MCAYETKDSKLKLKLFLLLEWSKIFGVLMTMYTRCICAKNIGILDHTLKLLYAKKSIMYSLKLKVKGCGVIEIIDKNINENLLTVHNALISRKISVQGLDIVFAEGKADFINPNGKVVNCKLCNTHKVLYKLQRSLFELDWKNFQKRRR